MAMNNHPWTPAEKSLVAELALSRPALTIPKIMRYFPGRGKYAVRKWVSEARGAVDATPAAPRVLAVTIPCLRCQVPFASRDRVRNRVCGVCKADRVWSMPEVSMSRVVFR